MNFLDSPENSETLEAEVYNAKNKTSPEIVKSLFKFSNKNYNFRNALILKRKRTFTVHFGSESLSSLAPAIWEFAPNSIRKEKTSIFKNKIKLWTTEKFPCSLGKNYIRRFGSIESCSNYFYHGNIIVFDSWLQKVKKVKNVNCSFDLFCPTVHCYCHVLFM